jgi:WD40 repeat protein
MMSRAYSIILALVVSVPAAAQTRVIDLKATADLGEMLFSPRGEKVAAVAGADRLAVWSLPDGKLIQAMEVPRRPSSVLFASQADELIVAFPDGAIEVRTIATGAVVRTIAAGSRQSALAATADGRLIASSGGAHISLWDSSGKQLRTFGHEFGTVASLAFSPDGTLLVSAGLDTDVHFWDVSTGQRKASLRDRVLPTFAVTFTTDGRHLVIGGANGAIEVVLVANASIARRFPAQKHPVGAVSLSPDGRSAGAAHFDHDGGSRPAAVAIWGIASGRLVRRVTPPGEPARAIGFGSDGRLLYALAKGPELSVWALGDSTSTSSSDALKRD